MDAFGDAFGDTPPEDVSAAFSDDPAADFLAREQEELGDLVTRQPSICLKYKPGFCRSYLV
jgi:hypothetical protein